MATRFKATDLKDMIRSIVHEEMKSVVTQAINEVLSERYLKEVASRVVDANRSRLEETLAGQTREPPEEIPEPMENDDAGIYEEPPIKKGRSLPESLMNNNPMAYLYEDVEPIPGEGQSFERYPQPQEEEEQYEEPAPVPMPRPSLQRGEPKAVQMQVEHGEYGRGSLEVKPDLMKAIIGRLEPKKTNTNTAQDQALLEQRLAERRKMLEVKPQ